MRASACVGRIGGLAVALGVGAGIVTGGIAVGWAAPAEDSISSADAPKRSSAVQRSAVQRSAVQRSAAARHNQPDLPKPAAVRATAPLLKARAARSTPATAAVESVPSPLSGPGVPGPPIESPANRMVLASARRVAAPRAAATSVNPIVAFFFNQGPTVSATQTGQTDAGVISGEISVVDPDSETFTYRVVSNPVYGTVVIDGTGNYTYTADPSVVHDGTLDAFQVTVSDAASGFHIHGLAGLLNLLTFGLFGGDPHSTTSIVNVVVTAVNKVPTATLTVGPPDVATGVVNGGVTAVDGDGDPLTYAASSSVKGTVVVDTSGGFVYVPTSAARHAAASLTAAAADKADVFTITVADDHGGSIGVPVSVSISPANVVPVAAPNVGSPNAATGVVAGTVIGVDADGDALSFSGSTTTSKGSVVVAPNGSFTYTPTALARHAAASATASQQDTTDTFTVTVVDGYGGTVEVPVSVTIAPAAVTFAFVYGSGSQYWSAEARSALETSATRLARYIVVGAPVTITYDVIGQNAPNSNFLASNYTNFTSSSAGYFGTVVQTKILTGTDANGAGHDSQITWNFAYPWALGDSVASNQYDFQSVAMHEMVHSLGMLTGVSSPSNMDQNWTTYDSFISTSDGTAVIGPNYVWNPAYTPNLTGGNGGLYFNGPNAVVAYGGPVPLYNPGTWASGSSISHLDRADAPAGVSYLMDPSDGYGPGVRVISAVEIGILTDLGYTISPGYAFFFIGFGLLRRRRGTPRR